MIDDPTQEMPALVWAPLRPAAAERPEDRTLDGCTRLPGLEDPDDSAETAESAPETADPAEWAAVDVVKPESADVVASQPVVAAGPEEAAEPELSSELTAGLDEPVPDAVDAFATGRDDQSPAEGAEDTAPSASSPALAVPEGERAQAAPVESVFGVEGLDPEQIEAQSARGDTIPVLVVVPPEVLAYQAETEQQGGEAPSWCTGGWHAAPAPGASPAPVGYSPDWACQVGAATADEPDEVSDQGVEPVASGFGSPAGSPDSAVQAEADEPSLPPAEQLSGTAYGVLVQEAAGEAGSERQVPDLANLSPTEYGYVLALPPEPEYGAPVRKNGVAAPEDDEQALETEAGMLSDEAEAEAEAETGSGGSGPEPGEPDVEAAAFELAPEPAVETDPELDEPEEGPAGEAEPEPVTEPEEAAGTVPESEPALESEALAETQEEAARTTDLQPDSAPETAPELPSATESEPAPEPKPALEPESDTVPEAAPQVPEATAVAAAAAATAAALPSPRTAPRSRSERPRSVLVTGASRGIGRAVAQAMLEAGEHVVGLSRSGEVPEGALGLATDVTDETSLAEAVARAEAEYGPVEVLVACAGIARDSLAARTSDATWEAMLDTDLTGVFRTVRAVLPQMMRARSGRIVLVSSVVASRGGVGQVAYGAAKAGVEGLVRSLARELAPRGITVNAVAPGFVATDMTSSLPTVVREAHVAATPIGRMATAQEVAAPVVFLASPAASYITGTVLPVDGGLGMGR